MGRYTLQSEDWMETDDSFEDGGVYSEEQKSSSAVHASIHAASSALCRILTTTSTNDEYDTSLENDRQLQPQQELPTPIHYHIYYPPDSDNNDRRSSIFTSCSWILISLIAVLAHVCYWYGPSVPPPPAEDSALEAMSWQDFLDQEAQVVLTILTRWYAVVRYVCFWCWEAISHEHFSSTSTLLKNCHPPAVWDPANFQNQVFGQDVAVDKFTRILDQDWKNNQPMIFYAIGGTAVGKKHLAHAIASQFTGPDCITTGDDSGASSMPILSTIPSNPALSPTLAETDSSLMIYQQMLDHATTFPNGSVILWPLEDNAESGQVNDLVMPVLDLIHSTTGILDKSILVMTSSSIGNPTLNKALRKYGRDDLPLLELESFLLYEVIQAHNRGNKSSPGNNNPFSKVHILPLLPWNRLAMRQFLESRLQELLRDLNHDNIASSTTIEENALEYILDHGMEWQTWIHKKTNQEILEFCPQGANALDPLLTRIALNCRASLDSTSSHTARNNQSNRLRLVQENGGNKRFQLVSCPNNSDVDDDMCTMECQFVL